MPYYITNDVGVLYPDGTLLNENTQPVSIADTVNVNVGNLPDTQPVSGTVNVGNLPDTQPISGSVSVSNFPTTTLAKAAVPAAADILANTLTANGTFFTVPAGRIWKGSISASAVTTVVGDAGATITAGGTTYYKLVCSGLSLTDVTSSGGISDVYIVGGASGTPVTLTVGGSGTTSASACGVLL